MPSFWKRLSHRASGRAPTSTTQASATIFRLRNVTRELSTPAEVAQVLLPLARAGLPPLTFQPTLEKNLTYVKFAGAPEQVRGRGVGLREAAYPRHRGG